MDEKKTSAGKLSYEAARDELAEIVESLEDGSASLEESLKLWERELALKLKGVEKTVRYFRP